MVVQINTFNIESKLEQFRINISFEEARKLIGLCYATFYAIFRSDSIPHERPTGKRKITFQKQDILDYMEEHKVGDWSGVKSEDITDDEKIDINEACGIIGVCYDTFYSVMRRKQLPRFQYNTKIVFYKSLILKYKESCKRNEWSRESA
jgi:predicted DNA-binding transcriptional regulator AlpA